MSAQELVAEPIERKIERSSFGTPAARRRQQRTSLAEALHVLALVEERDDWNDRGVDGVVQFGAETLLVQCRRLTGSMLEGLERSPEPADLLVCLDLLALASWKKSVRLTKLLTRRLANHRCPNDMEAAMPRWFLTVVEEAERAATTSEEQPERDDATVAGRASSFDIEAFYARNVALARAACRQVVRDPDAVDDIVHDVFVELLGQRTEKVDEGELSRWLQARVRGRAWRHLRTLHSHQRRTAPIAEVEEQLSSIADPTPDPGEQLVQAEQRELVEAALAGLSADDQQVLTLWMQGLDSRRLAEVLEVPLQLVHVRVHRARQRLLASLGALLVARRGPAWCEGLAGLLHEWDGRMQPVLRKRIVRHVQQCPACGNLEQLLTRPEQVL